MAEVKEHPILFTGEMVRAILDGHKTQTRRVIKGKWLPLVEEVMRINGKWVWDALDYELTTPYGRPGDRLWVKEGFRVTSIRDWCRMDGVYLRDGQSFSCELTPKEYNKCCLWKKKTLFSNKSKRFMFKSLARTTLEVKNIRVQRVQEISEEDAKAEGIERDSSVFLDAGWRLYDNPSFMTTNPIKSFHGLWDSINSKRGFGWDVNPWVWVIDFERQEIANG